MGGEGGVVWPHEPCCGLPTASLLSKTGEHGLAFTRASEFTTYLPPTQDPGAANIQQTPS